ncbi:UPAR/Ly6 domain-containing protein qvr [Dermacentor albipictus]|uniref:UPAR/Ly6 domain-containing protein qvr n=1 Tax=Dermacentor albipictus TaxID=60249 RepID=UPI0031FD5CDC
MAARPRRIASPAWITWAAASLFATFTCVLAEEECLNSRILCYDCNSEQEPRCRDPFNHSEESLPTLRECQGCCVKIVKRHGKQDQEVRRTCTERLQINMFLVDHVCMYESGGGGHMCFCESDACNSAPTPTNSAASSLVLLLMLLLAALQRLMTSAAPPPFVSPSTSTAEARARLRTS